MSFDSSGAEILGMAAGGEVLVAGDDVGDELKSLLNETPGVAVRDAVAKGLARDSAVVYKATKYRRARRLPIGFVSTSGEVSAGIPIPGTPNYVLVPPGTAFTVSATPQRPFRGGRLVIPSDIAGAFVIQDIKVQGVNQNPLGGDLNLACRAMQENAEAVVLHLDTADTNSKITISAVNISGSAALFLAVLTGIALYELQSFSKKRV